MGLYPNVCYHKEKRKVLTMESRAALVHKSSVNCSNKEIKFPSPFFIFGEKVNFYSSTIANLTSPFPISRCLVNFIFFFSFHRTKPTKWHVCAAKTHISLGIHPVRSESSLCALWVAKNHTCDLFLGSNREICNFW